MTHAHLTRRALIGAIVAIPVGVASGARAQGFAGAGLRFRGIAVDVSPLIDHGAGATADHFAALLSAEMHKVFADHLEADRRAPVLTARIANLFLSSYAERTTSFAFGNNDNIEGDGIVSAGGRILSSTHVLTELPPSYSGAPYDQNIDAARLQAIAFQFAYWLRREMNI